MTRWTSSSSDRMNLNSAIGNSIQSRAKRSTRERLCMIEELPEWLEKAEWDWRSAGDNLNLPQVNAGLVAFLCQQCAEKLLKAALIARRETPPKIHDLVSLSRRLSRLEPAWDWDQPELA